MKSFFFEQKSGVKFQQKNNESQSAVFFLSALVIFRLQMLYNTHTSMHTLASSDLVVYSKYSKSFLEISASTVEICTSAFFSLHIDCNDDFPLLHPLCSSSSHSWCSSWWWQVRDCGCKVIRHRVCVTDIKVFGPNIKNVVNMWFQFFQECQLTVPIWLVAWSCWHGLCPFTGGLSLVWFRGLYFWSMQ